MNVNIDSAIFVGFLVVNLALGLWSSRGTKTVREFAIGNRNFSTATIAATLIATWVSGETFFTQLSEVYSNGLYIIWAGALGDTMCLLSVAYLFAPRLAEFLGKLSIAEAMGDLYGKNVRMITAISGFIGASGMIAIQLKIAGLVFEYCFGTSGLYGIIISGAIITIYSSLGGIRSVTFTDVIQLFTFGTIIPTLAFFIFGTLDNIDVLTETIATSELFDYKRVFDFSEPKSISYAFIFLFILIPSFNPAIFQRITMAKDTLQVKQSFMIAGFACLFLSLTTFWVGTLLLATSPDLEPTYLVKHIISDYSYIGLKGLVLVGIMAMVMSTADSYINSTSVLIIHDFCKSMNFDTDKQELISTRAASFSIGIFAIILAMREGSLLKLLIATNVFYMPIVTVPFIMSVLGFRSTGKSVLIGMGAGFITVIIWEMFLKAGEIDGLIPGMLANLTFLLGSHYLLRQPGGWVGIKDDTPLQRLRQERKTRIQRIYNSITNFDIVIFFKNNSLRSEGMYFLFGMFCIISIYSTMHTIPKELQLLHPSLVSFIHTTVLFMATGLLSYPLWLQPWKDSIAGAVFWNISVFYILVFSGFSLVIISNFAPLQVVAFMINLIVIAALMRWQWALCLIVTGIIFTLQFFKVHVGEENLPMSSGWLKLESAYILLLIGGIMIMFLKPKQEYIEETEHKAEALEGENAKLSFEVTGLNDQVTDLSGKVVTLNTKVEDLNKQVDHYVERTEDQQKEIDRLGQTSQKILNNVNHELRLPIGNVINFADMLHETLQKTENNKLLRELAKEVYDNSYRVSGMILNMLDLATLAVQKVDLDKTTVNLSELVKDRINQCRKIYQKDKPIDFKLDIEPEIMISVDPNYMRQTVDNLVINAINFSEKGVITITVKKEADKVVFSITDQGKGIPKNELFDIFNPFKMGSNSESKACGRGVGLALCKSAVQAHGGSIFADSDGVCGAKLQFTLPFIATS